LRAGDGGKGLEDDVDEAPHGQRVAGVDSGGAGGVDEGFRVVSVGGWIIMGARTFWFMGMSGRLGCGGCKWRRTLWWSGVRWSYLVWLIRELIANVGVSKGGGLLTMDLGACPGKAKRGTPSAGSMVYLEADLAAVIKIFNVLQHVAHPLCHVSLRNRRTEASAVT